MEKRTLNYLLSLDLRNVPITTVFSHCPHKYSYARYPPHTHTHTHRSHRKVHLRNPTRVHVRLLSCEEKKQSDDVVSCVETDRVKMDVTE